MLGQLAKAERDRAQLAKDKHALEVKAASAPARPGAQSARKARPSDVFRPAAIFVDGENDARASSKKPVFPKAHRDESKALRSQNAELRSQRDALADDVSHLKSELARTRLVLHGMEYYTGTHTKTTTL